MPKEPPRPDRKTNPKPPEVLVVDDEPMVCILLKELLATQGFRCSEASNGRQALELLAARPFDLVVSDLRMPVMNGLELLQAVRSRYPQVAFVMATGENDVRVAVQAMKEGASDYIIKPFHTEVALASVQRALEKRRLQIELENYRLHLEEMVAQRTSELHAAMERIERTYDETLSALGGALELRDLETEGHSRRVTRYCLELARGLGLPEGEVKNIVRGSLLHDIGKIGIPDAILLKPGRLTDEELEVMQTHPQIGYELVCRIAFLAPAAEMVLAHQERWDGTGYPRGLKGESIPVGARIFAVADTLDAMTSDRPYRRALPFSVAREEIARQAGRQFDPQVVQVFLSISEERWQAIRCEPAAGRLPAFGGGASRPARVEARP